MSVFFFDLLSLLAVSASIMIITSRSPIVAVMWLIAVFVIAACYLVVSGVTFIGLTYLVVYVGAVAVLFLFVVMMLNVRLSEVVTGGREYTAGLPLGFAVGGLFFYEVLSVGGVRATYSDGTIISDSFEFALGLFNNIQGLLLGTHTAWNSDAHLHFVSEGAHVAVTQVQALGVSLYTSNVLWLLLVSLVLLLAMMGPIALCLRSPRALQI